jgi:hypothetical protein
MTKIIGYLHICQIGEWKKSFELIFNYVKNYGLYDATTEIRCGVVNENGILIKDKLFNDIKIKIVYIGNSLKYERPTLLDMRDKSESDGPDTVYWYLHTKGLRHFNTPKESFVLDWIKLMLYWNIYKWRLALEYLKTYDTYGCNNLGFTFYSGNFWWATCEHIKHLTKYIDDYYTAPEDWILKKHDSRRHSLMPIYRCHQ